MIRLSDHLAKGVIVVAQEDVVGPGGAAVLLGYAVVLLEWS